MASSLYGEISFNICFPLAQTVFVYYKGKKIHFNLYRNMFPYTIHKNTILECLFAIINIKINFSFMPVLVALSPPKWKKLFHPKDQRSVF
uniref:Uncharacterized protein n=1 Tax=Anguilla anguilla TaxID=7936 RepID=A0A0E9X830_ANGAN